MKAFFLAFVFALLGSSTLAADLLLPDCNSDSGVCQKFIHNEKSQNVTVLVWNSDGEIIKSETIELGGPAKLSELSNSINNDLPPPPSSTGSSDITVSSTYTTGTHVVTVVVVYQYYNGTLINVFTNSTQYPIPSMEP